MAERKRKEIPTSERRGRRTPAVTLLRARSILRVRISDAISTGHKRRMEAFSLIGFSSSNVLKVRQDMATTMTFTNRGDFILGIRNVQLGSFGSQHLSLKTPLSEHHSLHPSVVCRQQKQQYNFLENSSSPAEKSFSSKQKQQRSLDWNSKIWRHDPFQRAPSGHSRSVRMGLRSGSDTETEAALIFKGGRNQLWGVFNFSDYKLMGDDILREITVLALPALIAQAADPVAQLLETVYIGRIDEMGLEIALIALPAVLALAADPLASLVDTAFIGQIGPVELAAVGVSISVFNLVSKMFNVPLLNVTTSFVAEDAEEGVVNNLLSQPAAPTSTQSVTQETNAKGDDFFLGIKEEGKPLLPAVSSALVLGAVLGFGEACVLASLAGPVLTVMGVNPMSPMRTPAVQYLAVRALGAPAVVVSLAVQGVFRGFKDTKTPLYASLAGNAANILLDPILIFSFKFGVGGAAVATVASQYLIAGLLLWHLNKRVLLLPPRLEDLNFSRYLKSGGLLLGRTIALLMVMTLATAMAARQGAIPMAAHQISMQIWLAASLLSDSLALAGQAIIASAFAKTDYKRAKEVAFRVLQIGGGFGMLLAVLLGLGMPTLSKVFTHDADVLEMMALLLPFIALTQPIAALAFVFDGLHYGASDFGYAAVTMMLLAVPSILVLLFLPKFWGLPAVWLGLTSVMSLRMLAGFLRLGTATGPWRFLKEDLRDPKLD